jgi:HTH-type transcriptional regulator/antitoxin HigA
MNIKPIKTKKDHTRALKRLEEIFYARPGSAHGDELEILSILIEKYENEQMIIDHPDPIEAINFRMDQMGYKPKDLVNMIGYKSRVSEILHRKRKLTIEMIRILSKELKIPAELLIQ